MADVIAASGVKSMPKPLQPSVAEGIFGPLYGVLAALKEIFYSANIP